MQCSEDQLLAEEIGSRPSVQRQVPEAQHDSATPQVSTPFQSIDSQQDPNLLLPTGIHEQLGQQLPGNMHEQLTQQLPGSFASMSTSFMSPSSGAPRQFDAALQGQLQAAPSPHDPAWFREGHFAAALQEQQQQQQNAAAWQPASLASHQQLQSLQLPQQQQPILSHDMQIMLAANQQNLLGSSLPGAQQQWQQQQWDQQLHLLSAGLQDPSHNNAAALPDMRPQHYSMPSNGESKCSSCA